MRPELIDAALNGFVEQLFSQRRHAAVLGPRTGGALISDPATADTILRASDLFPSRRRCSGRWDAIASTAMARSGLNAAR